MPVRLWSVFMKSLVWPQIARVRFVLSVRNERKTNSTRLGLPVVTLCTVMWTALFICVIRRECLKVICLPVFVQPGLVGCLTNACVVPRWRLPSRSHPLWQWRTALESTRRLSCLRFTARTWENAVKPVSARVRLWRGEEWRIVTHQTREECVLNFLNQHEDWRRAPIYVPVSFETFFGIVTTFLLEPATLQPEGTRTISLVTRPPDLLSRIAS